VPAAKFGDVESYLVGERTLGELRFITLNSAWSANDDQDEGKLWLGLPHLKYLDAYKQLPSIRFDGKGPITVALMHHPPVWFHTDERQASPTRPNTIDYLARRCHILLTGHTHGEVRRADRIAEGVWHFTGGAAYAGASHFNSFRLLQVDSHEIVYRSFEFNPSASENNWKSSEARSLSLEAKHKTTSNVMLSEWASTSSELRAACRADAIRVLEQKSRILRPFGRLPRTVSREVSVRVSPQRLRFDPQGRFIRPERTEQTIPFYEAARRSRRTLLVGDLGAGKSTLGAQLAVETIDRSDTAVAVFLPAKSLRVQGRFRHQELLRSIGEYVNQQVSLNTQAVRFELLLRQQVEVLLVLDGLDEVPSDLAARMLEESARLPEQWPTIQVVATARPVELAGVAYADWLIAQTVPLDDDAKQQFIAEEIIADGRDSAGAGEKAASLLRSLKEMPALDSLANSPLAIRLVYPRFSGSSDESLTLGDLLYELLLERLGGWQKRDGKPSTFDYFDSFFPTAEGKAEFLVALAKKAVTQSRVTMDEAKTTLQDAATSVTGANKHRLAEEALNFFKWLGLIANGGSVEFPLRPLMEVAAAIGLLAEWMVQVPNPLQPDYAQWRIVSFLGAIARRRNLLADVRDPILQFISGLLHDASNLPAAYYVVAKVSDSSCAEKTVELFPSLGRRPLTAFGEERRASARNIAKTFWFAGDKGFDWFFRAYIDPRYPFTLAGSALVKDVFDEWASLARGRLTEAQIRKLTTSVKPYLATGEAQFFGVLNLLAVLVPDAFDLADRLWYQSLGLDKAPFDDWVAKEFQRLARADDETRVVLNAVLQYRPASSERAGVLWLEMNPDVEPPGPIIRSAFQSFAKAKSSIVAIQFTSYCRERLQGQRWLCFARWMLSQLDSSATGAAIALYDSGENRSSVLGDALMRAMHDGGYFAEAEETLAALLKGEGEKGVRWLASRMEQDSQLFGAHSGWWRVFLNEIQLMKDGPDLLITCVRNMGPFTLPRYPEVREAFVRLLNGQRGPEFRQALRGQLHSLDPKVRRGASMILVATDPRTEAEALFVTIRSRAGENHFDYREWESFRLTLDFAPSVLSSIKGRLSLLDVTSRALALVLLLKAGDNVDAAYRTELELSLLAPGNWHLAQEPAMQRLLQEEASFNRLIGGLQHPGSEFAERAAQQLMDLDGARLSSKLEAECLAITTKPGSHAWKLSELMVRVARDRQFSMDLSAACKGIRDRGGSIPLLGLVLRANSEPAKWKDVVWTMLCDDMQSGAGSHQADTNGDALMDYALKVKEQSESIGQAAIECLDDPRMLNNRWADAYHWLAVIGDEFVGLKPDRIRAAVTHGLPITLSAATSLVARLGEAPKGLSIRHTGRLRPATFPRSIKHETDEGVMLENLKEYSRDSEDLHPAVTSSIEKCLFLPEFSSESLSQLASIGWPGALIGNSLRFCYGLSPKLAETLPVLDFWGKFWTREGNAPLQQLLRIWAIVRESAIRDDQTAADEYLASLDERLVHGDIWELPLASEILRIRGSLSGKQVRKVFLRFARFPT
jgi:hypothetical protein